jgi:hypothetical protein
MSYVSVKTVNDYGAKGVIVTAETLLHLKNYANQIRERNKDVGRGADEIISILEDFYYKIK